MNSSNPLRIGIFLFLLYSFGIEKINTFIHFVVPSKTIPDSVRFQTKMAQKPSLIGRYTPIWLI